MQDLVLDSDVKHGIDLGVTILEEQGRLSWIDAIGEALTCGLTDSPCAEEGEEAPS